MSEHDIALEEATQEPVALEVSEAVIEAVSPKVSTEAIEGGHRVTVTDIDGSKSFDVMDGERGLPGLNGLDGQDGETPTMTASKTGTTTTVTFATSKDRLSFDIEDGEAGAPGQKGFSPQATVTKTGSTATIRIVDMSGVTTATVSDGATGASGADGFSPTASVSKSGSTATIAITDKNGTTMATVSDGQDGQDGSDGEDGFSPTASVSKSGSTATITITDKNGTSTATVSDGAKGDKGDTGATGPAGADYVLTAADKQEIAGMVDVSGKVDEPATEGTSGQVLTTDGQGGRSWQTVQGGGGGEVWEKLMDVTTAEEVAQVKETLAVPGCFKKMYAYIYVRGTTTNEAEGQVRFGINGDILMDGWNNFGTVPKTTQQGSSAGNIWFEKDGAYTLIFNSTRAAFADTFQGTNTISGYTGGKKQSTVVTDIRFTVKTATYFGANSIFRVWGVRA